MRCQLYELAYELAWLQRRTDLQKQNNPPHFSMRQTRVTSGQAQIQATACKGKMRGGNGCNSYIGAGGRPFGGR